MPKKRSQPKLEDIDVNNVRARSINLVDEQGKVRAALFFREVTGKLTSSTVVQLMGDDGLPKLDLQVDGNSPGIRLTSPNDTIGFSVSVTDTANGIMIGDSKGRPVIQIGIYHHETKTPLGTKPAIVLSDFQDDTQEIEIVTQQCRIIQPMKKSKKQ